MLDYGVRERVDQGWHSVLLSLGLERSSCLLPREDCKSSQGKNCRGPILDGVEFGMLEKPPNGDVYEVTEMELKEIHCT